MDQDILAPEQAEKDNYKETDVFAWANNMLQYKEDMKIELFLISKNYVLYKTTLTESLKNQLEPRFIDGLLE